MTIETERLTLSEITLDDISERYVSWLNDELVRYFLETRFSPQNMSSVEAFVRAMIDAENELLFTVKEKDGTHIGNIKIGAINHQHNTAEISYFIGERSKWGLGYAKEMIKAVVDYAFDQLNLRYLKAGVYSDNVASSTVLEKNSFQLCGVLKQALLVDGKENDHLLYCLHRDWR